MGCKYSYKIPLIPMPSLSPKPSTPFWDLGGSQNWGYHSGGPIIRIIVFWGLYWGPPILLVRQKPWPRPRVCCAHRDWHSSTSWVQALAQGYRAEVYSWWGSGVCRGGKSRGPNFITSNETRIAGPNQSILHHRDSRIPRFPVASATPSPLCTEVDYIRRITLTLHSLVSDLHI